MSICKKKLVSIALLFAVLFAILPATSYAADKKDIITTVEGLGLMKGYPDGSFNEDGEITRAEMTMVAARMLLLEDVASSESPFTDVSEDHWAKNVITTLYNMKLINGVGNGKFAPDEAVTFNQAVKIIVSALGYSQYAEEAGGYPDGYIAYAAKLGILKNVGIHPEITRGEVAAILYEALEVRPTGLVLLDNRYEMNYTLYDVLTDIGDLEKVRGVVMETPNISLISQLPELEEGHILIGDKEFQCDYPMDAYIGKNITAYVREDDFGKSLVTFYANSQNEATEITAKNVVWNGEKAIIYDDNSKKIDEISVPSSDVLTVYNNIMADIPVDGRNISYGSYIFLNNDYDNNIEILFINEAQSFIVDRVNVNNSTVYFQDRETLNGRNAVLLENSDDDDDKYVMIEDTKGNPLNVDDIEEGDVITVFASLGNYYVKAVINKEHVDGAISAFDEDTIVIDEEEYGFALRPDGTSYFTPKLGTDAEFALDLYGNIVNTTGTVNSGYKYAYVIEAERGYGFPRKLSLMTVSGQAPKKEVKVSGDNEIISYYFQNELVVNYDCANRIKLNGEKIDASDITPTDLNNNLIAFKLNSDGLIKEIYTEDISSVTYNQHEFNAGIMSFGGETLRRGYATDEETMFICIPEDFSIDEDDYYVQVKVVDESTENKVYGTVFFPDTSYKDSDAEPVDILVISTEMDSSAVPIVQRDSDICIVGKVNFVIGTIYDDEDVFVPQIELLNGTGVVTEVVKSGGAAEDVAKNLKKGDLIRYSKDGFGRIVNITKIVSSQGLGNDYSNDIYIGGGSESAIFGQAYDIDVNVYDYYSNQMVDKLQLTYSTDGSGEVLSNVYRLFQEEPPKIYMYDRENGWIYPGTSDDIVTYTQIGSDADKILAIIENNDIKTLVIIKD